MSGRKKWYIKVREKEKGEILVERKKQIKKKKKIGN